MITDIWVSAHVERLEEIHENAISFLKKSECEVSGNFDVDLQRFYWMTRDYSILHQQIPKWDIIYDRREGISIENPVKVRNDETAIKYAVKREEPVEKIQKLRLVK